jgi:hypothetical protein
MQRVVEKLTAENSKRRPCHPSRRISLSTVAEMAAANNYKTRWNTWIFGKAKVLPQQARIMYFLAVGSRRCDMQQPKLSGEPLSIDQLIEYLPALNEVARTQPDNWATGASIPEPGNTKKIITGVR